jgi:hypothetical protein
MKDECGMRNAECGMRKEVATANPSVGGEGRRKRGAAYGMVILPAGEPNRRACTNCNRQAIDALRGAENAPSD